ncbi:MAG TPA: cytochrome c [Candidatus Binatia bacterium]|nr:cytochrome c [Candidatus Binatia bacterium]
MRSPVGLNVVLVVLGATAFYTYVGQLVPQKELLPPAKVEITQDMTPVQLAKIGGEIAHGKGLCTTCHTIGSKEATHRFPDLAGVAERAKTRVPGLDQLQYFAQTLCDPNAFVVPGFNPGMPTINKPPVGLNDEELHAVIAWLESQGGEPSITLKEKLPYCGGAS